MKDNIDIFFNNNFRILKIVAENQGVFKNDSFCPLSQEEISALSGVNRVTVNASINLMKKEGFIQNVSKSRHYKLTDEGIRLYKAISKL